MPPFFYFLLNVRDAYGATSAPLLIQKNGDLTSIDKMTDEQKRVYKEYKMLEYDYI